MTLLSNRNENEVEIDAKKLQKASRNQRKENILRKIAMTGMRFAKVNGDCCWEAGERYLGGEKDQFWNSHTYYLPWSIRSIKLIDC